MDYRDDLLFALEAIFSDPMRDVNGADLVEALSAFYTDDPGVGLSLLHEMEED